jgi:hypothetical protein
MGLLPGVGDGVLVSILEFASGVTGDSIADTRGNSYTLFSRNNFGAGGIYTQACYYCSQVATALQNGDKITYTQNISSAVVQTQAYKVAHVSLIDAAAEDDHGSSGATASPSGAITLATADELLAIYVATEAAGTPMTDPSGYSKSGIAITDAFNGSVHIFGQMWWKEILASGSYTAPSVTLNGSTTWTYTVQAYKASSGTALTDLGQVGGACVAGVAPSLTLVDSAGTLAPPTRTSLQAVKRAALWCQAFRRHGKSGIFLPEGIWTPQAA